MTDRQDDMPAYDMARELEELTVFVRKVRTELAAISPGAIRHEHIAGATDQLEAMVSTAETSANQILDACEGLEGLATEVGGPVGARIDDAVGTIYAACNFHDLTGQRVVKVARTLGYIEARLAELMGSIGIAVDDSKGPVMPAVRERVADDELLNGPQLPGNGVDQSEIDRLLAAFD